MKDFKYVIDLLKRGVTKEDLGTWDFGQVFGDGEEEVEVVRELVDDMYDFDFDESEDFHGPYR